MAGSQGSRVSLRMIGVVGAGLSVAVGVTVLAAVAPSSPASAHPLSPQSVIVFKESGPPHPTSSNPRPTTTPPPPTHPGPTQPPL